MTQWAECDVTGIPLGNAKNVGQIIVGTSGVQWPLMAIPPSQWVTIDYSNGPQWGAIGGPWQPNLPLDVKGIFLSGILIISHPGNGVGTCNIIANFRAPGSSLAAGNYQMQTLEAGNLEGVRSNAAVWVPMVDRKIEFYWQATPTNAPAMLNLSMQAYIR